LTASSLARPRRDEFLLVLQLGALFGAERVLRGVADCSRDAIAGWSPAAIGVKAIYTSAFGSFGTN
jgi:hypothetical protein